MSTEEQVVEQTDAEVAAEFNGGFDDTAVVAPADEPKMAQIPEDEYRKLLDGVAKLGDIEGRFDTAFGKIGGVERALDQLRSATPAGGKIELTEEVVADLAAEFPEMAQLQFKTLQKLVDVINTSTPAQISAAQPSVDVDALKTSIRRELTEETLDGFDEKWREIIGLPGKDGVIPDTPFRQWLEKQPKEYATQVKSTYSAAVLTGALSKFKTAQAKAQGRREVLDAAVEVTGSGGQAPAAGQTGDDEFNEGFKS